MKNGGKNKSVAFIILVSVYIYIYIYIHTVLLESLEFSIFLHKYDPKHHQIFI